MRAVVDSSAFSPVRGSGNREVDDLPDSRIGNAVAVVNRFGSREQSRGHHAPLRNRWDTEPLVGSSDPLTQKPKNRGLSRCDLRYPYVSG